MVDSSPIAFYAPDRAVVIAGTDRGNPVEFIRNRTARSGGCASSVALRERTTELWPLKHVTSIRNTEDTGKHGEHGPFEG